jgi:hypothetical protein
MVIGDTNMKMHFGFDVTCKNMKLIIWNKIKESRCHYCNATEEEDTCAKAYTSTCDPSKCWYSATKHGGWEHTCFIGGGNVHRIDIDYSVYDAKKCTVSSRQNNYIENYPGDAYVVSVTGTLIAQSTFVEAFIGGLWQNYKENNGDVSSNRAFLTPLENFDSKGKLKHDSYQFQRMVAMREWDDIVGLGWESHYIWPPEFDPVVFDQQCQADITFNKLKCFRLPEVCNGTFVINEGVTYFKSSSKGICNGKIVSDEEYTALPAGVQLCQNCSAGLQCAQAYGMDGSCNLTVFKDQEPSDSSGIGELVWYTWEGLTSTMQGIAVMTASIIALVLLVIVIIVIIINCCRVH